MEYRVLGSSGVKVSSLCLGTMNFGGPTPAEESIRMLNRALAGGINFIDTANVYNGGESERIVGRALKENGQRDSIVLATKVYNAMGDGPNDQELSRYHIVKACEDSLRRLQTDRIDLYQLHRPSPFIPHEETLRALDDLVRAGKVLSIGSSTFPAWIIMEGLALSRQYGWVRYTSEQPPYNLLDRRIENELIPLAQKYNLAVLPWSPLAMGLLAGKYLPGEAAPPGSRLAEGRNFMNERVNLSGREVGAKMVELAQERGVTAAQLALLWCKDQPGITAPIIGPRTLAQVEEALPVLEMSLKDEDRPIFDSLVHPGNAVADFHNSAWWMKARIGN
ncbi:MAG: aldo/keto reductase [Anaerolineae bacterium]|nr:aldo/keto reductase [Anaerolineales bacterium]MCQ3978997.1 aldo/keto reductase [Anaerolineae bacterium]